MDSNKLLNDVLRRFSIATEHSTAVLEEVERWKSQPNINDPSLADWTALPFVTIDNPDSRDLDQALLIESQANGYRCRYALADAYHYVQPGSALFKEALERGSSYYLPGRVVPMLPVALSEDLVSLNANVNRRAIVFDMTLTKDGECINTEIVRARIKSHAKLSYEGVQRWFDGEALSDDPAIPQQAEQSIQLLKVLGLALIERSLDRDVIQFDRRETEISLTDAGFELRQRDRYDTERYNEQISLLCNMQGAKLLQSMNRIHPDLQPIFRVHEAPLKRQLNALEQNLEALVKARNLDKHFQRQPEQSLADYVTALPNGLDTQRLVQAIERQVLMTNQASEFRAEPGRHHALGAASYARFSSPMREMVGIFTHKELLEALGEETPTNSAADTALRADIIEAANSAKQQQKQIGKAIEFAVIEDYLKRDLKNANPTSHNGTVMGFRSGKIYVAVDDLAVDLKVYLDDLSEQYGTEYSVSDVSATPNNTSQPTFILGDAVAISAREFDKATQRFRLNLVSI